MGIHYTVRRALESRVQSLWILIYVFIRKQSRDIAGGVDMSIEARNGDTSCYANLGTWGDQGVRFTVTPTSRDQRVHSLAAPSFTQICKRLDTVRRDNLIHGIKPDGKTQVPVEYEDGKPKRVKTMSGIRPDDKDEDLDVLKTEIIAEVLHPVFTKFPFDADTEILSSIPPADSWRRL